MSRWWRRCKVYPRVCGGTFEIQGDGNNYDGLSPRVRGNPQQAAFRPFGQRSIPACAGEPNPQPRRGGMVTVYPRVCGGTMGKIPHNPKFLGLSPRVRGNRI